MRDEPEEWQRALAVEREERQPQVREALQEFWTGVGRKPLTARHYQSAAQEFLAWVGAQRFGMTELGPAMIQRYFDERGGSRSVRRQQLKAVRHLYELLVNCGLCEANRARLVRL
jgi:site-specific recombinase XerD